MPKPMSAYSTLGSQRKGRFLFDRVGVLLEERFPASAPPRIVEVGSIRDPRPIARDADGWSTTRWPEGSLVWSVDTDPRACKITKELAPLATVINDDGVAWVSNNENDHWPIDVLYLDGPDATSSGQKFHLDLIVSAAPLVSEKGLVLIDDCDFDDRGKGKLVIPWLESQGWMKIDDNERQVLFGR